MVRQMFGSAGRLGAAKEAVCSSWSGQQSGTVQIETGCHFAGQCPANRAPLAYLLLVTADTSKSLAPAIGCQQNS